MLPCNSLPDQDPRLDQRRLSEADSWQAEILRTESILTQRHYDAAKVRNAALAGH
jgi:hypothetical protein